jgi:hypothetical protein
VIIDKLAAAVNFIRNVRERIDAYVQFGRDMTAYLRQQTQRTPKHAAFLNEMLLLTQRLDQFYAAKKDAIHTPAYAEETAAAFKRELLTATGPDAFAKCKAQMAVFTSIGGAQDDLVAACRMIVKVLRQRAGLAMAEDPALAAIATEIRTRTQAMLRKPTAYEAPRH